MDHYGSLYFQGPKRRERHLLTHSELLNHVNIAETRIRRPPWAATQLQWATTKAYGVATGILSLFFGKQWVEQYIAPADVTDYMRRDMDGVVRKNLHLVRTIMLAEMIFNLQRVAGLEDVLDQLRDGMIEPGMAELEAGMLLMMDGVAFRFVETQGVRGKDYDLELFHPNGVLCCAETKAKVEATTYTINTILHSLQAAQKQLPPDRPGIIFLKLPEDWVRMPDVPNEVRDIITTFFRGTKRVVCVQAFGIIFNMGQEHTSMGPFGNEFINPSHRFDHDLDWRITKRFPEFPPLFVNWVSLTMLCIYPLAPNADRPAQSP